MKVLILAAGLGSRLMSSVDESLPKAHVSLGEETILERQIRQLSVPEVTGFTAVVGQQGDCWTEHAVERFDSSVDDIVVNKRNAETEAGYSFLLGLESLSDDEDVLVIDGDIVVETGVLRSIRSHDSANTALVKATETKLGSNDGACITFSGSQIDRCSFDIRSNYVYCGVMKLSADCIDLVRQWPSKEYEQAELATLIDEIAQSRRLHGYTINPTPTLPVVESPLDGYDGAGNTTIQRRKGKIIKQATAEPKKLRNEVEQLQYDHSRYPDHFPEILDISFFSQTPRYEMIDYTEQGYTPLDQLIQSGADTEELATLSRPILEFILTEYGEKNDVISGIYKNAFLPKIRSRYGSLGDTATPLRSLANARTVQVNGSSIPGLPRVIETLETNTEFLGLLEPPFLAEIHGDFKPDNILVDRSTEDFVLIDPRGRSEIGTRTQDPLYDIGKFYASTSGYYTALKYSEFDASVSMSPVSVEYDIRGNTAAYDRLSEIVLECTEAHVTSTLPDWKLRLYIIAGLLLISNAPVQIDEDGNNMMATVELVRGLELFERGVRDFTTNIDAVGNMYNINTKSDLSVARSHLYNRPQSNDS